MSKLDDIKNQTMIDNQGVYSYAHLSKSDFDWIIEQAEKAEKYKTALEFYANDKNHESPIWDEYGEFRGSLVDKDAGTIAQEALGMFD